MKFVIWLGQSWLSDDFKKLELSVHRIPMRKILVAALIACSAAAVSSAYAGRTTDIKCSNTTDCDKLAAICLAAGGNMYEWNDGDGNWHGGCEINHP